MGFVCVRDWTLSTLSVNNKDFIESAVQLLVQAVRVRSIWGFEAVVSPVFLVVTLNHPDLGGLSLLNKFLLWRRVRLRGR